MTPQTAQLIPLDGGQPIGLKHGTTVIGRNHRLCDVELHGADIAFMHCTISATAAGLVVRQTDSQFPITVNEQAVTERELRAGDILACGHVRFRVAVAPSTPTHDAPVSTAESMTLDEFMEQQFQRLPDASPDDAGVQTHSSASSHAAAAGKPTGSDAPPPTRGTAPANASATRAPQPLSREHPPAIKPSCNSTAAGSAPTGSPAPAIDGPVSNPAPPGAAPAPAHVGSTNSTAPSSRSSPVPPAPAAAAAAPKGPSATTGANSTAHQSTSPPAPSPPVVPQHVLPHRSPRRMSLRFAEPLVERLRSGADQLKQNRSIAVLAALILVLVLIYGVGNVISRGGSDRPDGAEVAGQVTVNGEPLEQGFISFIPTDRGRTATALVANGRYTLTKQTGPMPGRQTVTITGERKTGKKVQLAVLGLPGEDNATEMHETEQFLPPEYNAKSTLTADFKLGRNDDVNFELKLKAAPDPTPATGTP